VMVWGGALCCYVVCEVSCHLLSLGVAAVGTPDHGPVPLGFVCLSSVALPLLLSPCQQMDDPADPFW
jgi:hypothetical protein